MKRMLVAMAVSLAATVIGGSSVSAALLGPSPYVSSADSPFSPFAGFSYFHLENFEDHLLNTPGVTTNGSGCVTSVCFGPDIHDSVDADDGTLDGSGLRGDSMFSGAGATGIRFTFDAAVLGTLPDAAGIVWTDGSGTITFEAFDAGGVSLGTVVGCTPNGSFSGETAEDCFFGVTNTGGISAISIRNGAGGIEVDHLQYGLRSETGPSGVPAPGALALLGIGLAGLGLAARRKRS